MTAIEGKLVRWEITPAWETVMHIVARADDGREIEVEVNKVRYVKVTEADSGLVIIQGFAFPPNVGACGGAKDPAENGVRIDFTERRPNGEEIIYNLRSGLSNGDKFFIKEGWR